MKLILALTFVILTLSGFSQTGTSRQLSTFATENFKIQYPASWTIDTSRTMGAELFIFSEIKDDSDKFRESVDVIIQDLKGQNIDLNKYRQISERQIKDLATDAKIYESRITTTRKGECYKLVYAMTQGILELKIASYCFIENEKAYLIDFTSELDKFDKFENVNDQIINSFELTK